MFDPQENIENSDIIIRYLSNETNELESNYVKDWIHASNENKIYFESVKKIYENNLALYDLKEFNPDNAWYQFKNTYLHSFGKKNKGKTKNDLVKRTSLSIILRIAAIIVILIGIWSLINLFNKKNYELHSNQKVLYYKLPDGSSVSLNSNSSVSYNKSFGKNQRELTLQGEVFFEVKPDRKVPFVVHVENVDIEVVGTSFDVNDYLYEKKVAIVVKSGIVKVRVHYRNLQITENVILKPGDKAEFIKTINTFKKEVNNNPNYISWKTKVYIFEKTDMSDVIKILEKDFNVKFELTDNNFKNCKLYARFENKSLSDILEIIKLTFSIEYFVKGEKIFIKGKGC